MNKNIIFLYDDVLFIFDHNILVMVLYLSIISWMKKLATYL